MPARERLSVSTTAETLFEADPRRTYFLIINTHATQIAYIDSEAGVTATRGIPINANYGSYECVRGSGSEPEKKWYVIASGAATNVFRFEAFGSVNTGNGNGGNGNGQKPDKQDPQSNNGGYTDPKM